MNQSRQTGLLRLRHLQETTEAVAEDMQHERQRFQRLRDREPVKAVAAFNLFQTPEPIAELLVERLIDLVGELHRQTILEPSAGLGRLYRAVRAASHTARVTLVEQAPQCSEILFQETAGDEHARQIQADFLECTSARLGEFSAVLMNPPFKQGRDIKHIRHAWDLLPVGGALVALCYAGTRQHAAFHAWNWELLPSASFRAEGTRAEIALISRLKS